MVGVYGLSEKENCGIYLQYVFLATLEALHSTTVSQSLGPSDGRSVGLSVLVSIRRPFLIQQTWDIGRMAHLDSFRF